VSWMPSHVKQKQPHLLSFVCFQVHDTPWSLVGLGATCTQKPLLFLEAEGGLVRPWTTSRSATPTRFEHLLLRRPVPPSSRSYFESNPNSYRVSFYFVASEFCRGIMFWWITFVISSCLLLYLIKTTSLLD
jgi:hypothetical protein